MLARRIGTRLTYANVMATIAVFIALGGGAYAAFSLPRDSVKSKHIVDGQVKSADVQDDGLAGVDIVEDSLRLPPSTQTFFGATGGDVGSGSFIGAPSDVGAYSEGSENVVTSPAPEAMVATDLAVSVSNPPIPGSSRTLTLRVNGVNTALSCTILELEITCSDSGEAVAIDKFDFITLRGTATGSPMPAIVRWSWQATASP